MEPELYFLYVIRNVFVVEAADVYFPPVRKVVFGLFYGGGGAAVQN